MLNQAEDRAHRIGQKNSVNIYYMNGRGTVDDQIFELLHNKALVTTDVTDGFRTSLNINKTDLEELPVEEFANKDGTVARTSSNGGKDSGGKQSLLEKFFEKKNLDNFNKRTKPKGPVIAEEIDESSSQGDQEPAVGIMRASERP